MPEHTAPAPKSAFLNGRRMRVLRSTQYGRPGSGKRGVGEY